MLRDADVTRAQVHAPEPSSVPGWASEPDLSLRERVPGLIREASKN